MKSHRIALISGAETGSNFQTHFEIPILFHPVLHNGKPIDTHPDKIDVSVLKFPAASTSKCRLRYDRKHLIPTGIQDEIHLKDRPRGEGQVTRHLTLKAEVSRL
jgi:hypothetical protein